MSVIFQTFPARYFFLKLQSKGMSDLKPVSLKYTGALKFSDSGHTCVIQIALLLALCVACITVIVACFATLFFLAHPYCAQTNPNNQDKADNLWVDKCTSCSSINSNVICKTLIVIKSEVKF